MNCKPMVMFYFFLFILYTWHICLSLFSIFCFLLSVTYFKYTACSAKHINLNSLKYTPTFSIQNRTQLISDSSLIILPCWLPCKTLPNRFKQLLRMHNYRTHVYPYTIYMYPIYICIDCATAHYFGKFFATAHAAGKWKLMFEGERRDICTPFHLKMQIIRWAFAAWHLDNLVCSEGKANYYYMAIYIVYTAQR